MVIVAVAPSLVKSLNGVNPRTVVQDSTVQRFKAEEGVKRSALNCSTAAYAAALLIYQDPFAKQIQAVTPTSS
jgi:hypothetical protein